MRSHSDMVSLHRRAGGPPSRTRSRHRFDARGGYERFVILGQGSAPGMGPRTQRADGRNETTKGETHMATFPRTDAQIKVLAQNMIAGLTANPADFPSPPVTSVDLQALLTADHSQ